MTPIRGARALAAPLSMLSLALGMPASPAYHSRHWLWLAAAIAVAGTVRELARWNPLDRFYRAMGCIGGVDAALPDRIAMPRAGAEPAGLPPSPPPP